MEKGNWQRKGGGVSADFWQLSHEFKGVVRLLGLENENRPKSCHSYYYPRSTHPPNFRSQLPSVFELWPFKVSILHANHAKSQISPEIEFFSRLPGDRGLKFSLQILRRNTKNRTHGFLEYRHTDRVIPS